MTGSVQVLPANNIRMGILPIPQYWIIFFVEFSKSNGEGGIRTPVELPQNAFRVRHHQPLGHLSKINCQVLALLLPFQIITQPI